MNEDSNRYRDVWDRYWKDIASLSGEAFWDCPPEQSAALDLPRFKGFMPPGLPLVDFGCGNGTLTRFLAKHFERVIGLDISAEAIAGARDTTTEENASYEVFDALKPENAHRLHAEVGDCNLYVRTVLHQMKPPDWPRMVDSLEILLGETGCMYIVELAPSAEIYFRGLAASTGGEFPPKLARVFQFGITPAELKDGDIVAQFPSERFSVRSTGYTVINTTQRLPNGEQVRVPAEYWLISRRAAAKAV